jgi:hypothetical protein
LTKAIANRYRAAREVLETLILCGSRRFPTRCERAGFLKIMMPKDNILILNVVDTAERNDFRYFDNESFVETFVKPKGYDYFTLDKDIGGERFQTIIFECSLTDLQVLDRVAYPGSFTDIDGFILKREKAYLFAEWHAMGNTDKMFRDLSKN